MNIIAGIISLVAVTSGLPEVMWLGETVSSFSARSMGMGESGFTEVSALGVLINPALMGLMDEGLQVEVSAGMDYIVEKRTRRVYNQFESSIGESEYSFNRSLFFNPGGAAVAIRGLSGFPETIAFAAGWRVPATFGYSYGRIIRDDSYVRTGEESLEISGILNEFSLALAFMPSDVFSFGLSGGFITGSRDVSWEVVYVDTTLGGTTAQRNESHSGIVTRGSVLFAPDRRVFISASLEYPMPLSVSPETSGDPVSWNTLSDTDYDLDMPVTVHVGSIYIPGNRLRSRFTGEFHWSSQGSLEFQGESLGLRNSWGVNAGVENTLPGGPVARFGFGYRRSPVHSSLDRMSFTAGLGFRISDWSVDIGASFSPDRWNQMEVPGLPSFVPGDSLIASELSTGLMFTVSRWFTI